MSRAARQWSLDELLGSWAQGTVSNIAVNGVNLDSRLVEPGDVYLAIAGASTHGIYYAMSAVRAGAVAVVVSSNTEETFKEILDELARADVPVGVVPELETLSGEIASRFYGEPDKSLTIIAVTGTNGKTSVCRFIAQALSYSENVCGYIGTLGWGIGNQLQETALTTPDSVAIRRMLADMFSNGARFVALEASSHGIAEGRLEGLSIDVAVLTNLARDHLDYHVTIEAYRAAKERLFHWETLRAVVANADDAMGQDLILHSGSVPVFSYSAQGKTQVKNQGKTESDVSQGSDQIALASHITIDDKGLGFRLDVADDQWDVNTPLLGRFNVANLLACFCSLRACGLAANDAFHAINAVSAVPGRMELLGGADQAKAVIDYSHTPDALAAAISSAREHCARELWVVFGCGGDRDTGKRPEMARAAQVADHVVLTDDNPRSESSGNIINDVLQGFDNPQEVKVIADRALAIHHALGNAVAGDLVLIAGKGHESYQLVGAERYHFSDREQVLAALELQA